MRARKGGGDSPSPVGSGQTHSFSFQWQYCFQYYMFCLVLCEIHLFFHYFASLIKLNIYFYLLFQVLLFPAFELLTLLHLLTLAHSDLFPPVVLFWDGVVLQQLCICFCQSSLALKDRGALVNDYFCLWFLNYANTVNLYQLQA